MKKLKNLQLLRCLKVHKIENSSELEFQFFFLSLFRCKQTSFQKAFPVNLQFVLNYDYYFWSFLNENDRINSRFTVVLVLFDRFYFSLFAKNLY